MTLKEIEDRLDYISYWQLRGGNDPEDPGSPTEAVADLIEVVRAIAKELDQLGSSKAQEGGMDEYGACRRCGDEVSKRDLSDSGLCIECRYEMDKRMPDLSDRDEEDV